MDGQDWTPVRISGRAASGGGATAAKTLSSRPSESAIRMAKLDAAETPTKPKVLSPESVAAIQTYRREHTLTQKELDQRLSFPANTINGLESKRISPTPGQLRSLNQLLKTGLTLS